MSITIDLPSAIFGAFLLGLVLVVTSTQTVTSPAIAPAPPAPEVQGTIRAKRVESVDDKGEVCVLL